MKNRRYVVVIMDSSGRDVRRLSVPRRTVEFAAGCVIAFAVLLLGLGVHGLVCGGAAREALDIHHENRELTGILQQLEKRMPEARSMSLYTELSFSQLWAKSGLGVEPRLLSVGPTEGDGQDALNKPILAGNDLLNMEPVSLPLELERIEEEGTVLQSSLGDTLEYFHDAQLLLANTPSIRPTQTPWLTSSFGKRLDPVTHTRWVMHKGLDMGGHIGLEVDAPADGVVIWTGLRGGYGMTVVVDHGYGLQTHFAHLSKYLVHVGDHVRRGDPLAEMGSTGRSTGPHLHYEVRRAGQPMDPRRFILD